ncbi:hypothetical protein LTR85_008140 [Meristemomyces frigidus]|nr:hypothetical protein LTR85_008140 [Meristemomyces frigidus]
MAFRKRNIAVSTTAGSVAPANAAATLHGGLPGVRPSPLTSHPVTSTGATSLDDLLGGHVGLALGSSLLIGESGTTDFAGALLRFYAAEGLCQGHVVHAVGVGDSWVRDLPGVADERSSRKAAPSAGDDEKMKIAWRYEKLGQAGERGAWSDSDAYIVPGQQADQALPPHAPTNAPQQPFCHTFDLSKSLIIPQGARINHIAITLSPKPFDAVLQSLTQTLKASSSDTVHRLVLPTVLSPALWPTHATRPEDFLQFLHSLRSLLHQYAGRLTAMMTLPLELHPRSSGLVRWAELLSDGVLELTPFPHLMNAANGFVESGGHKSNEERPQGMLKVHKLPITTERGEGGAGAGNSMGEDLAFTVSRRKFVINPFSLPPMEGDQDAQKEGGSLTGKDVEF